MRSGASGAARPQKVQSSSEGRSWRGVGSRNLTKKDGGLCKRRVETCDAGRAGTQLPSEALHRTRPRRATRIARERVPNDAPAAAASRIRRHADTFSYCQEFAVETASSFAFLTAASMSAGAARVGSTKMLVTSVIPMNPKTPPRVLLCRS